MSSAASHLHHPVVVTGASTGIGRATTERLARAGTPVIAGVRKQADFDALARVPGVEPVILDVTKADDVAALAERVRGTALSGLVNNAGSATPGPLEALPLDDLRAQFELNVFSCVAMAQATIPALRLGRGRIVNIGSIGGRVGQAYVGAYCGSKGAIHLMTASMRQELRPWKIWVACVEPGTIATEIWGKGESSAEGLMNSMSPEHQTLYGARLSTMRDLVGRQTERALAPDDVAERIEHALTARRPKGYYLIGHDARFLDTMQRVLPVRARDRLLARLLGV